MIFVLSVVDWGLHVNRLHHRDYYPVGAVMQTHLLVLGSHVWIERNRLYGETLYRVAFGACPKIGELITFSQLQDIVRSYFLGLVEVSQ